MLPVIVLSMVLFSLGLADPCDTYPELESQVNCGANGYLMYYGHRNCESFFNPDNYNRFDTVGKAWVNCTGNCLADEAREIVSNTNDCDTIKTEAFESHVDCYLSCGICTACRTNKRALSRTFNVLDFLSLEALKQATAVAVACNFQCLI